jgi:hypothetical protein
MFFPFYGHFMALFTPVTKGSFTQAIIASLFCNAVHKNAAHCRKIEMGKFLFFMQDAAIFYPQLSKIQYLYLSVSMLMANIYPNSPTESNF